MNLVVILLFALRVALLELELHTILQDHLLLRRLERAVVYRVCLKVVLPLLNVQMEQHLAHSSLLLLWRLLISVQECRDLELAQRMRLCPRGTGESQK